MSKHKIKENFRPGMVLMIFPLIIGIMALPFLFSDRFGQSLGSAGAARLVTRNWQIADNALKASQPEYERKFAYYKLKEGENLTKVSQHFSVPETKLTELNPGILVAGTTIRVPPLQFPLTASSSTNNKLSQIQIREDNGIVRLKNGYKYEKVVTSIPELTAFLAKMNVFSQTGPKSYRLNRPLLLDENIRLNITSETVNRLELRSSPNRDTTCLCITNGELLIKDTTITSYDPTTQGPDHNPADDRSFIRVLKSSRMDIINSQISYLGTGLRQPNKQLPLAKDGGTYGISWRIPDDMLGVDITTGWVEGSTFYKNHFGSYTFGASGMVWRNNHFLDNDVYGLDPHDDSNNALIEGNIFERNGKHGFIISKRCNYNIIRNNVSFGNGLHGFMLHQDSTYNAIENNLAYDNADNYVIFASSFNIIRNNKSYNARRSHIRINESSSNNFIINNTLYGGSKGIFIYGMSNNIYVKGNIIEQVGVILETNNAQKILLVDNLVQGLDYRFASNDRVIFGPNKVSKLVINVPNDINTIRATNGSINNNTKND